MQAPFERICWVVVDFFEAISLKYSLGVRKVTRAKRALGKIQPATRFHGCAA